MPSPRRWSLMLVLAAAAFAVGCGHFQTPDGEDSDANDPAAATTPAAPTMAAIDPAILAHPARSDDARFRDGGFKPLEVYAFFGIEPGMHVADMMPGGGYNTVLVSQIVGEEGHVTAILGPRPETAERVERSTARLSEAIEPFGLSNVSIAADPSGVADGSLDLILTVRNYHDLGLHEARLAVLPEMLRMLKPGGTYAVIDAYTNKTDERDETVHRINDELARSEITAAGFEFVEASDLLVNPDDTYDFDGRERAGRRGATEDAPIHRYFVHRWVHKYRRPIS